jgi:hypothetical protein
MIAIAAVGILLTAPVVPRVLLIIVDVVLEIRRATMFALDCKSGKVSLVINCAPVPRTWVSKLKVGLERKRLAAPSVSAKIATVWFATFLMAPVAFKALAIKAKVAVGT